MISSHDHGNCELCDQLERDRAQLVAALRKHLTLTASLPAVTLGGAVGQSHIALTKLLAELGE